MIKKIRANNVSTETEPKKKSRGVSTDDHRFFPIKGNQWVDI